MMMVFFLAFPLFLQITTACEVYRFANESLSLQGHVIKTIKPRHIGLCWDECVWLPWCFSINVRKTGDGQIECELNNSSKTANPSKMVVRQGWTYQEMKDVNKDLCTTYECKRKEDLGDGWYRYGNASIKLFTDKKNWTHARSHCQSLGGDLLSISSSHENDFVYDVFVQNLNLTYMQEETGIQSNKIIKHFKLNGEEQDVTLVGVTDDVDYRQEGREKVMYIHGKKGCAKLPQIAATTAFTFSFWIKILDSAGPYVVPMNIYDQSSPKIIETSFQTSDDTVFFTVKGDAGVTEYGHKKIPRNKWVFLTFSWVTGTKTMKFGYQGKFYLTEADKIQTLPMTETATWSLGCKKDTEVNVQPALHGYLKHVIISTNLGLKEQEVQTVMYWHEQGVWIGLNAPSTDIFEWSDGSPVAFNNLPSYAPLPVKSKRNCVGIGKDHIWLDKQCTLKYPYLCEKPAPP